MKKRILSLVLALVMTLSLLPSAWAAELTVPQEDTASAVEPSAQEVPAAAAEAMPAAEQDTEAELTEANSFLLLAANNVNVIIAPERVPYTEGQTIGDALNESGHAFTGLDIGFVTEIDGQSGTFSRMDENGSHDLGRPASNIKAMMFVTCQAAEGQAEALYSLARAMLEWQQASRPMQVFCREQYDNATKALISGGDFAALAAALTEKMVEYLEYEQTDRHTLKLSFRSLDGQPLTDYTFTALDPYGNEKTFIGESPTLAAGSYAFTLDANGNGAEGELTVDADGNVSINGIFVTELAVPEGTEWIGQPELRSRGDGEAYPVEQGSENRASVVLLPDTVDRRGSLFLYAEPGTDLKLSEDGKCYEWDGCEVALYVAYDTVDGNQENSKRAWQSDRVTLNDAVKAGTQENTVYLKARAAWNDYEIYQTWMVTLERTPTLCDLRVTANGIQQNIAFSSAQTQYECTVTTDTVELETAHMGGAAYTVTVNGQQLTGDTHTLALTQETTEANITVTNEKHYAKTYTVVFTKKVAVPVGVSCGTGVSARIFNAAGVEIGKGADGTYLLTPGETYTYITTKNTYYHATGAFTVPADSTDFTAALATPEITDHLTGLLLASASKKGLGEEYLTQDKFNSAQHTYSAEIYDQYTTLYAWASADDDYEVMAIPQGGGGTEITAGLNITSGTQIANSLKAGSEEQTLEICACKTVVTADKSVTHYQDYQITFTKTLTIQEITLTADGQDTLLFIMQDGKVTEENDFFWKYNAYHGTILRSAEEAQLTVTLPFAGYGVQVNGSETVYQPDTDPITGAALTTVTIPVQLSPDKDTEEIILKAVCDNSSSAYPYTITLQKSDPIHTAVTVTDEQGTVLSDALAVIYDDRTNTRIWPEEGSTFALVDGLDYTCVATCAGYVGQKVPFTAGSQQQQLTIKLKKAAASSHGQGVSSDWPSFRKDNSNNGVVSVKAPTTREDAVLSWAVKLGDGYGGKAISCPILITQGGVDYLVAYSDTKIYKVEAITGTVVAEGTMAAPSNFAINSATFGNGMLFVGLEKGTIQAFDADTLESLWLYHDPLKGQANCTLTYANGCVYTGFWNNETSDANFVCLTATDEDPGSTNEEKLARWTYTSQGGFYWAGAYVDPGNSYLLVGTDDGASSCTRPTAALLCLDPATGAVLDKLEGIVGDVRCSIAKAGDRFYFTTKGGYFYSVQMNGTTFDRGSLKAVQLRNSNGAIGMSTSTPVVYNGRAYVGVSGSSQFTAYSGHSITVIDLGAWDVAYSVPTMGYPQTSGLLTAGDDGAAYVYFFDNYTPGILRVLKDQPGQTSAELENENGHSVGYALFTPMGDQAQYAICSPIVDKYGTLYFKNDSGYLMALTSAVTSAEVTKLPQTDYTYNESFDPTGMELTVTYANGMSRKLPACRTIGGVTVKYATWDSKVLQKDDNESPFFIDYPYASYYYYNTDLVNEKPVESATLLITVNKYRKGDVNGDGSVDVYDLQRLYEHCNGINGFTGNELADAGLKNGILEVQNLYSFLTTGRWDSSEKAG